MSRRDMLDLLSDILQVYNTSLLEQDASNNDVIKELQHQNKDYLENILSKLNNIEKRIERLENDTRRND